MHKLFEGAVFFAITGCSQAKLQQSELEEQGLAASGQGAVPQGARGPRALEAGPRAPRGAQGRCPARQAAQGAQGAEGWISPFCKRVDIFGFSLVSKFGKLSTEFAELS